MPLEDDILFFKAWANRMGAPVDDLPNDDALKSVFKSRQTEVFFNLMRKVRPRRDVVAIRQNILLSKTVQMNEYIIGTSMTSFLPKELQRYMKIENLKKRKAKIEAKLIDTKNENEALGTSLKAKNIKKIQLKYKLEALNAKANILEIKADSLDDNIIQEEINKERIISLMPVTIKPSNVSESLALYAIEESSKVLEEFYNMFPSNHTSRNCETKNDIWVKLRKIFFNIPNYVLWCAILNISEEQLQQVIYLTKMDIVESIPLSDDSFSLFEIAVLKARTMLFSILTKCVDEKQEIMKLSQAFLSVHQSFVNDFQLKINLYNTDNVHNLDEILSDYIVKYNTRAFNKAQSEYLEKEIEMRKIQIIERNRKIEDHQMLLGSTRQIYNEIDSLVNRILHAIFQLGQIKEKIIYSKNLLQYMLNDMQVANHSNTYKTKISNSTDSFEISDVLCSTKVDLENSFANTTLRSGSETVVFNNKANQMPQHATELAVFKDLSMGKLEYLSKECFFYLHPNPLITNETESPPLLQLIPGFLLTPDGSLQDVKTKLKWNESISQYSAEDIKVNVTLHEASEDLLNAKNAAQQAQITELLDEIDCIGVQTQQKLNCINKYYKFILDNSLRHFIPSTKLFNNRTYNDYASEYKMYYRMALSTQTTL